MKGLASEEDFIACIDRHFPNAHRHVVVGRGDDCAVLACPERLCVSTDLFIEDVHFRRSYFRPEEIGHKALAVNVSDVAAMGGVPLGFSLALMTPPGMTREYADALFAGMSGLAAAYGMVLTGGDLSRGGVLGLSITVWGEPVPGRRFLRRGGCRPDDVLFAVGSLGLARAGLCALEASGRDALRLYPEACAAHLTPNPQVAAGQLLARYPSVALMDLSDGLARDVPRLVGLDRDGGLGAALELHEDDLHDEVMAYAIANGLDPVEEAFAGGEDYALLGACPEDDFEALREEVQGVVRVGTVTADGLLTLNGLPPSNSGFDHFA
ncbi:MAG TPA: thiamine-phosphate kinase [Desulfovibrio sp.]|nr:thiamine-phosphate kinase [Desulfovibrio sp.]